jgi:hypothetical protein
MAQEDIIALKEKIKAAFAARPYPGDDQLVDEPKDWEIALTEEVFRGLHWSDVAPEVIECHNSALSFFTPAAWRFYLPAFMLVGLDNPGGNALASLCYDLVPPDVHVEQRQKMKEIRLPRLEVWGLSPEQAALMNEGWEQAKEFVQQRSADGIFEAYERTRFSAQMDSLTAEEKSVVREFLEYFHRQWPDNEDTQLALERYWRQF